MSEPQRVAFEHWYTSRFGVTNFLQIYRPDEEDPNPYFSTELQTSWTAWQAANDDMLKWVVERWSSEIRQRSVESVLRRTIDKTWRQMIRYLGGDDTRLEDKPK